MSFIRSFLVLAVLFTVPNLHAASFEDTARYEGTLGTADQERANFAALFGRIGRGKISAYVEITAQSGMLFVSDEVRDGKFPIQLDIPSGSKAGSLQVPPNGVGIPSRTLPITVDHGPNGLELRLFVTGSMGDQLLFTTN